MPTSVEGPPHERAEVLEVVCRSEVSITGFQQLTCAVCELLVSSCVFIGESKRGRGRSRGRGRGRGREDEREREREYGFEDVEKESADVEVDEEEETEGLRSATMSQNITVCCAKVEGEEGARGLACEQGKSEGLGCHVGWDAGLVCNANRVKSGKGGLTGEQLYA